MDWRGVESKEELEGEDLQDNSICHFFFLNSMNLKAISKRIFSLTS